MYWFSPLIEALAFCIKMGFAVYVLVYGIKYLADFVFTFLTEDLGKKPE